MDHASVDRAEDHARIGLGGELFVAHAAKGRAKSSGRGGTQLFAFVSEIRETIRLSFPDHAALAKAFGAGHRAKTSADARDLSSLVQNSYADQKLGPLAREAGIAPAQVAQAVDLRQQLVLVAGERLTNTGATKGDTTNTKALVRRLEKTTTRVIDVAKLVFKGNAKILAEFVRPSRRSPKKKAKKAPSAPTGT